MDFAVMALSIVLAALFAAAVFPEGAQIAGAAAVLVSIIGVLYVIRLHYRHLKTARIRDYDQTALYFSITLILAIISLIPAVGRISALLGAVISIVLFAKSRKSEKYIEAKPLRKR